MVKTKKIPRGLELIAKMAAKKDVVTACSCITYQPQIPESVNKLKRRK